MLTSPPEEETAASELAAIVAAVRRLYPSWQRPEAFHEQKSEVIAALRRLSRRLVLEQAPRRLPVPRPAVPIAAPIPAPPGPPMRFVRFVRGNMLAPVPVQPPRQAPVMAMAMAAPVRRGPTRRRRHIYPLPPPGMQPRLRGFDDEC